MYVCLLIWYVVFLYFVYLFLVYDDLLNQNFFGSEDEIIDIFVVCMGGFRIVEDGELCYYGLILNFYVYLNGSYFLLCLNIWYVEIEGLGVLE